MVQYLRFWLLTLRSLAAGGLCDTCVPYMAAHHSLPHWHCSVPIPSYHFLPSPGTSRFCKGRRFSSLENVLGAWLWAPGVLIATGLSADSRRCRLRNIHAHSGLFVRCPLHVLHSYQMPSTSEGLARDGCKHRGQ